MRNERVAQHLLAHVADCGPCGIDVVWLDHLLRALFRAGACPRCSLRGKETGASRYRKDVNVPRRDFQPRYFFKRSSSGLKFLRRLARSNLTPVTCLISLELERDRKRR